MRGAAWVVALPPPMALFPHALAAPAAILAAVLLITASITFLTSWRVSLQAGRLLACGLGCLAGTIFLVGIALPPRHRTDAMPALILASLACAGLVAHPRLARFRRPILAIFALAAGIWLAIGPAGIAAFGQAPWRILVTACCLVALSLLLAEADAWTIAAAALALFAALHAVGTPSIWPLLSVIPAAACAVAPIRPPARPEPPLPSTPRRKRSAAPRTRNRRSRRDAAKPTPLPAVAPPTRPLLPASLALAILAAAAAADQSNRPIGPADAASLAPAAAAWLMARWRPKLPGLGPAGGPAKAAVAVALVALIAFSAAALTGLR